MNKTAISVCVCLLVLVRSSVFWYIPSVDLLGDKIGMSSVEVENANCFPK